MKTPVGYWKPSAAGAAWAWTVIREVDGEARQLVLAANPETGHWTMLTEVFGRFDTAALGPQVYEDQEEIVVVGDDLYDGAQVCCRPVMTLRKTGGRPRATMLGVRWVCRPAGEDRKVVRTNTGGLVP